TTSRRTAAWQRRPAAPGGSRSRTRLGQRRRRDEPAWVSEAAIIRPERGSDAPRLPPKGILDILHVCRFEVHQMSKSTSGLVILAAMALALSAQVSPKAVRAADEMEPLLAGIAKYEYGQSRV